MEQKDQKSRKGERQGAFAHPPTPPSAPGTEAPLAAVLEAALDAIVTLDDQGKVLHFNPAAERLFGYTQPDALGRDISDLIAPRAGYGSGDREFQHYFTQSKGPVLLQRHEMLACQAGGGTLPVELTLVRLATEEPLNYTAYVRDLSEQKRTEAAVRESEERYRDLIENANDIIYTHDLSGRLTSWNQAGERITGYRVDEIEGMNIANLVAPDCIERALRHDCPQGDRRRTHGLRTRHFHEGWPAPDRGNQQPIGPASWRNARRARNGPRRNGTQAGRTGA